MYLTGEYINEQGAKIVIHIQTDNDRDDTIEIGESSGGVYFSEDPVEIAGEVNDTFDHLLRSSATIRLQIQNYMPAFFHASCRDAVVNIYRNGECIFAGFVEPQIYSQPYNEEYDEIELNCIDALSALQYSGYKNAGSLGTDYLVAKTTSVQRTFKTILIEILDGITSVIDIEKTQTIRYLYDGSKSLDSSEYGQYELFDRLKVSDLLFFGASEDELWYQDRIVEEMLRYLNLHIVQEGMTFYIFSWETIKRKSLIQWQDLKSGESEETTCWDIVITTGIVSDCGTKISISEVYNKLMLTCKVEEQNSVVESPLDADSLESPYSNKQLYCTEISSDGEGMTAFDAMYNMCKGVATGWNKARKTDWYLRVLQNPRWKFPCKGGESDLISKYCREGKNQQVLPDYIGQNPGAMIVSLGRVDTMMNQQDNSPTLKIDMSNQLIVAVNGNGKDGAAEYYPQDADIKSHIPQAVYEGDISGGNFSPVDESTINYIVISGTIVLNPLMKMTAPYKELYNTDYQGWWQTYWHKTVWSRDNGDNKRYYTRKYWKSATPTEEVEWNDTTDYGLIPYSSKGPEEYEFKYSAIGDSTDTVSKVAALACMLVIGNKCVVESGSAGQTSDFEWRDYKPLEECDSEDEYYQQSFTIGFNPKIGDKLIGVEYDIQNNIDYTMGLEVSGTAIPIKKSDKISGQVRFMILGPVNTIWDVITRRHPTFFRKTKWNTTSIPLLAHLSNIILKSFEVKVYSDNGKTEPLGDNDIVYLSDTSEKFTNIKDDIEFKIHSALTVAECNALGVKLGINLSSPIDGATGDAVISLYDQNRGESGKPEQQYVDSYYVEYRQPRVIMEQNLIDTNNNVGRFNHYRHEMIGKDFFVQNISRNLTTGIASITLKEIEQ